MTHTHTRLTNPILHYGILFLIYGVGALTLFSHTLAHAALQHSHQESESNSSQAVVEPCPSGSGTSYKLTFTTHGTSPSHIEAHRCDTLTISNSSSETVIPAFGPHEHHQHYAGFEERDITIGQSYTFRLVQAGNFVLHDHDNEGLRADLTVK